jgi:hypothetical protein
MTDFPLLQRIALPITVGAVRYPGVKIHDPRVIRLFEVLLHGGTHVGGWTAKEIHAAVLATFHLSDRAYGLNQLRYDLRKLKGHALIERDGSRYAYRLFLICFSMIYVGAPPPVPRRASCRSATRVPFRNRRQ